MNVEQEMRRNRLKTLEMRKQHIMKVALADGIITDHVRDGICEQLVTDGWLVRADALTRRGGKRAGRAYLPTEKASQDWQRPDDEPVQPDSE